MHENRPPGSARRGQGNAVQADRDRYGVAHLSSGDILRRERAKAPTSARRHRATWTRGALVPDEMIVEMMISRCRSAGQAGCCLDGFPRTRAPGRGAG